MLKLSRRLARPSLAGHGAEVGERLTGWRRGPNRIKNPELAAQTRSDKYLPTQIGTKKYRQAPTSRATH